MASLVLTMIGDDQAGLVARVAEVVRAHGGNWERSQLAELGGKFAGIALVQVPDAKVEGLTAALQPLNGLIDVEAHSAGDQIDSERSLTLDLVGNDRPGIVSELAEVIARFGASIDSFESTTSDAPMGGGRLFEARAELDLPASVSVDELTSAIEGVAQELMVDIVLNEVSTE